MKTNTSVIFVNFKSKSIEKVENLGGIESSPVSDCNSNFRQMPINGNFHHLSKEEVVSHSNHLLKFFNDLSDEDVFYFMDQGVLDIHKANEKLNERMKA